MIKDTICATSTASGTAALGIIRVSGKDAVIIVNSIFRGKNLTKSESHTVHYGFIVDGENEIDEVMVAIFKAPKTFTAEDLVEISCHGSNFIQQKILSLLLKSGARLAEPGEFTQRAFLNGRIDLSQAEAVSDLISAENSASHQIALNQMRGGISSELKNLREHLINFTALIELELDFSEEDVEFANRSELEDLIQNLKNKIQNLIQTFEYGNAIKNGVPVAIIGKPNAGKSTLLNYLLNEERAIVSEIAGTTRDTIEESITLDGITFRFIDTAGIRETQDEIEAIGVEKAKAKVKQAKIVLHLYEVENELPEDLQPLMNDKIVFHLKSKIDQNLGNDNSQFSNRNFSISVKTGYQLEKLKEELVRSIQAGVNENSVILSNLRHKEALQNAYASLIEAEQGMKMGLTGDLLAFHLRDSLKHIGSITGQIDVDQDILGTIFGKFCIGK